MTNDKPATDESGVRMDSLGLIINGLRCELGTARSEIAIKQLTIEALQSDLSSQKQSYEDVIAAMDKEIGRLRGLCGEAGDHIMRGRNHGSIRGRLDRASKGESHE